MKVKDKFAQLPPPLSTGDPDSFAMRTITDRHPAIIEQIIRHHNLPAQALDRLSILKEEMQNGSIVDPIEQWEIDSSLFECEEAKGWRKSISQYLNQPWLGIPWYFAEAFFYYKLLCAFGYYDAGFVLYLKDPFQHLKDRELYFPGAGIKSARELAAILLQKEQQKEQPENLLYDFIHFSLWGNRIDLSNYDIAERSRGKLLNKEHHNLLIDHSKHLVELFLSSSSVDFILDNSGPELVCDLFLILAFLTIKDQGRVILHLKKAPFLVSDAIKKDVDTMLRVICDDSDEALSRYGSLLEALLQEDRLCLREHFFWNSPEHFDALPSGLRKELSESDLIILKGDANYRRLLGDRKWKHCKNMEDLTAYFPKPFAVLRTLKSEIMVDVPQERAAALQKDDPEWLTNGKRGIIRVCPAISGLTQ